MFCFILEYFILTMVVTLAIHWQPSTLYYAKLLVFYFLCGFFGFLYLPFWALRPQYVNNFQYAMQMLRYFSKLFGLNFSVIGIENMIVDDRECIVVCNHQSSIDLMAVSHFFPPRCIIMAKKEVKFMGPFGLGMWLCGTLFVNRGAGYAKVITHESAKVIKDRKVKLLIFPEGTRNKEGIMDFKKGAFYMAVALQIPIVPVVVSSYKPFYSYKDKRFDKGNVTISILPPITTEGLTENDVTDLTVNTHDVMIREFDQISK